MAIYFSEVDLHTSLSPRMCAWSESVTGVKKLDQPPSLSLSSLSHTHSQHTQHTHTPILPPPHTLTHSHTHTHTHTTPHKMQHTCTQSHQSHMHTHTHKTTHTHNTTHTHSQHTPHTTYAHTLTPITCTHKDGRWTQWHHWFAVSSPVPMAMVLLIATQGWSGFQDLYIGLLPLYGFLIIIGAHTSDSRSIVCSLLVASVRKV